MGSYNTSYAGMIEELDAARLARLTTADALEIVHAFLDFEFCSLDDLRLALRILFPLQESSPNG